MDPITDMLNRITNAQKVRHNTVEMPFSNLKLCIAGILKEQGFVLDFKKRGRAYKKKIIITLKYTEKELSGITGFKRVSKPGQRIYKKSKELRRVKDGFGIAIVSTSKGLFTDKECRKQRLGGEVMLEIW